MAEIENRLARPQSVPGLTGDPFFAALLPHKLRKSPKIIAREKPMVAPVNQQKSLCLSRFLDVAAFANATNCPLRGTPTCKTLPIDAKRSRFAQAKPS